jgi:uncharacterized surface protein with fasciclin (FAS1) repeats
MQKTSLLSAAAAALLALPAAAQDVPAEIGTAVEAAEDTGMIAALVEFGPVTVFVPTNDAIAAAPQDPLNDLLANPDALADVIRGYAVPGTVLAADAIALAEAGPAEVESVGGGTLTIMVEDGMVMVGPDADSLATVITPDLTLGNVTVHVIDGAFLPEQ